MRLVTLTTRIEALGRWYTGYTTIDVDRIVAVEHVMGTRPTIGGGTTEVAMSALVLEGDVRVIADIDPNSASVWWPAMVKGEHISCARPG